MHFIACAKIVERKKFIYEKFVGEDDYFLLVKSGSFSFSTPEREYAVKENEGAMFKKGVTYYRKVNKPVTLFVFRFRSERTDIACDNVIFSDVSRVKSTIELLDKSFSETVADSYKFQSHLFADLINQYSLEHLDTYKALAADEKINNAIIKIKNQLHNNISVERLAGAAGLSYVQFLRRFKNEYGIPPKQYIANLKLQKAQQLLSEHTLMIKDIAHSCGFENEYYFSNFFKHHTGMSPTEYRDMII